MNILQVERIDMSENTVNVFLAVEVGIVTEVIVVPQELDRVVSDMNIQLTLSYNTAYNVSVLASCGEVTATFTRELAYGESDLQV